MIFYMIFFNDNYIISGICVPFVVKIRPSFVFIMVFRSVAMVKMVAREFKIVSMDSLTQITPKILYF